jgi:hypothetical protein
MYLCTNCKRYARQGTTSCPFCAQPLRAQSAGHARAGGKSRAAVVLGTAGIAVGLAAACGSVTPLYGAPPGDAVDAGADTGGTPAADAGRDASDSGAAQPAYGGPPEDGGAVPPYGIPPGDGG